MSQFEGAASPFWKYEVGTFGGFSCEDTIERVENDSFAGVFTKLQKGGNALYAYGDVTQAVPFFAKVMNDYQKPDRIMIDNRIAQNLPAELKSYFGPFWDLQWEFFYAEKPIPDVPHTTSVSFLPAGTVAAKNAIPRIDEILSATIPDTSAREDINHLNWFVHSLPNGLITAAMGMESNNNIVHYAGLGADPQFAGCGYGSAVLVASVNQCFEMGFSAVQFGMWSWNSRARKLYQRLGFVQDGKIVFGSEVQATEND